jgi:hypothetical protein
MIEKSDSICCHVTEGVGHLGHVCLHESSCDDSICVDRDAVELRRQTTVSVVEANHEEALIGVLLEELLWPRDHLGSEAHDPQHRRILRISERVELEVDTVTEAGARHGGQSHRCNPAGSI